MSSLREAIETGKLGQLAGYMPYQAPAPPPIPPSSTIPVKGTNRNLRSPLPQFASSFDSTRQFNEVGITPRFRLMPLPNNPSGGGSTVNISQVTASSSSGGTSSANSLPAKTVVVATPVINSGDQFTTIATMARSFQLLNVTASLPCGVRLYGSAAAQSLDTLRAVDAPVAAEVGQDIITDVVFDTSPFSWDWQNRLGANSDTSQSTTIYVTIVNTQALAQAVSLVIRFVPLQTG